MSSKILSMITSVMGGLLLATTTAHATSVGAVGLDPPEYFESLRVGTFNNPSTTFTGSDPGSFGLLCAAGSTQTCASVSFESQPVMSLTATVMAFPVDSSQPNTASSYSQVTGEALYFYEIKGPASSTPIPLVLTTYVEFLDSVGNNRSFSIQGAAETRLDGVNAAGFLGSTFAISDLTRPPNHAQLSSFAFANTQYDIALIANQLTAFNNGTLGIDPAISASIFIDPVLSFAPGFDSTGYTITFSDGVGNGGTAVAPEPATFAMFGVALLLLFGFRRLRNLRAASGKFSA